MKGITHYIIFLLTVVVLASGIVIGSAYGIGIAAVQHGITRAMELFSTEEHDRGFAQLARIDNWAVQHPALISRLRCASIVGYVTAGNDDAAITLADRELEHDLTPPPPASISEAFFQMLSEHLDPICLKRSGGRNPDPKNGYRTLLHALEAIGDDQRLERLNRQLTLIFGKDGLNAPHSINNAPPGSIEADSPHDFGDGRFAVAAGATIRCYSHDGKHCGDLVPGALVTVTDIRTTKDDPIAICQREEKNTPPLFVRTRDLIIHHGNLSQIPPAVRSLLVQQGQASAALRRARRQAALRNPYASSYSVATAQYKALQTETIQLTTKRDQAQDNERMHYAEQLQLLKNKEPELRKAYETAKRNYAAWKAAHAETLSKAPAISNLQTRVDQIATQLAPYFDS